MRMTINQLHKRLAKLIEAGHGRKPVCVNKSTFTHNCEGDGCTILDVAGLGLVMVPQGDDDGGIRTNADGSESYRACLVLVGDAAANEKGEIVNGR